jgi:hypothetical protein
MRVKSIADGTAVKKLVETLASNGHYSFSSEVAAGLKEYVDQLAREYTMLIPGGDSECGPRLRDWKLVVKAKLEPDI